MPQNSSELFVVGKARKSLLAKYLMRERKRVVEHFVLQIEFSRIFHFLVIKFMMSQQDKVVSGSESMLASPVKILSGRNLLATQYYCNKHVFPLDSKNIYISIILRTETVTQINK